MSEQDSSSDDTSEELKRKVFEKGEPIPEYDASIWRRDSCGHAIKYSKFGNANSIFGWEIDHIVPLVHDGTSDLENLQPLYWRNNRMKADQFPWKRP